MKNSFYFDHDYNARNDQKILDLRAEYGWDGYGKYFALLECLCESRGYIKRVALGGLSLGLSVDKESLINIIDFCISLELFHEDECGIYSKRIHEHLEYRKMLSEYGKRGGRGNKAVTENETEEIKPPFSPPLAPPKAVKERKVKESKGKILNTDRLISYRQKDFYNSLVPFLSEHPRGRLKAFYDFWSELTQDQKKMKCELEKTWETKKRLDTWKRREKEKINGFKAELSISKNDPTTKTLN
jgi:hypothetical protein